MELALDNKKKEEQQINQNKYQAGNAPLSQPGIAEQMGTRIKNKAMDETMKKGMELGKESLASLAAPSAGAANTAMLASTPATIGMGGAEIALAGQTMAGAGAGAAGAGAMAALGPIGIGLAADELLGLGIRKKVIGFDEGGQVGPLNSQYYAQGTMTEEQARALMNNQPEAMTEVAQEAMPMLQPRSINFPEAMTEVAQEAMPMLQPPRRRPMAEELFDEIKAEQNYVSSESLSPPGFSEELAKYMQSIGQPFGGRQ